MLAMTDMNIQCKQCGCRGERGDDVVIYRVCWVRPEVVPLCDDCASIYRQDGVRLDRLVDQSGELPEWAA